MNQLRRLTVQTDAGGFFCALKLVIEEELLSKVYQRHSLIPRPMSSIAVYCIKERGRRGIEKESEKHKDTEIILLYVIYRD